MTIDEIKEMKENFKHNELYQKSCSPFKDFQLEQFFEDGKILEGQHSKKENLNGKEVLVIFNFRNGLIHSDNDLPAIEYPDHWEYWKNGYITKVVDNDGDTVEYWANGVPIPIHIDNNLSEINE